MDATQSHPLHVRFAHWINALTVVMLLWSGFSMFAGDKHFAAIVGAIPAWLLDGLQLPGHALAGRAWHLAFAIVFLANAAAFVVSSVRTGTWRRVVPQGRAWLGDALRAAVEELRAPREALARSNYNPAQRVAYASVYVLGAVMIVTGIALWFGRQLPWLVAALGGKGVILPAHVIVATALLAFIGVHLLQVARAGVPTLVAMLAGPSAPSSASASTRTRRALSTFAVALLVLPGAVAAVRAASGPTGVPGFLAWTIEKRDGRRLAQREGAPSSDAAAARDFDRRGTPAGP